LGKIWAKFGQNLGKIWANLTFHFKNSWQHWRACALVEFIKIQATLESKKARRAQRTQTMSSLSP